MLTKITVYSQWSVIDPLVLNVINREETDLFEVRDIDGLGPVKASVNTTPMGSIKGASFDGTSVAERNLVFTIGLNPDWDTWTVSRLRRELAKYFMPEQSVRLVFEAMEYAPVEISGIVESNDPNIFSKDPEHKISIICPSPDFKAVDPTIIETVTGLDPVAIDYQGDVETGVNVVVVQGADGISPTIVTTSLYGPTIGYGIDIGDLPPGSYPVTLNQRLELNTIPGNKYIRRIDELDNITNLRAYANFVGGRKWLSIDPQSDSFTVWSDAGVQDVTLTYYDLYGSL